jgi:hypothetical protein
MKTEKTPFKNSTIDLLEVLFGIQVLKSGFEAFMET